MDTWLKESAPTKVPGSELHTVPGIYGWNQIDTGSGLLVSSLPELEGHGADIGCGWGYLAWAALQKNAKVNRIEMIEADTRALACAKLNIPADKARFHWLDATAKEVRGVDRELDWVVMNPPFHEGATVNAQVGRTFIETAAYFLKSGGKLYMVANEFLAYEDVLGAKFREVKQVLQADGYKVIHARR